MQDWIILMALVVAAAALAAAGIALFLCRKQKRERDRALVQALREQNRLVRELEHLHIEKETVENIIRAILPKWDATRAPTPGHGQNPPQEKKNENK